MKRLPMFEDSYPGRRKLGEPQWECVSKLPSGVDVACGECCRQIMLDLPGPDGVREADYILWVLYHGITVVLDTSYGWGVLLDIPCKHLLKSRLCGVYEDRPALCRENEVEDCEPNQTYVRTVAFRSPVQFMAFMREAHPKVFTAWRASGYAPDRLFVEAEALWQSASSSESSKT